MNDNASLLLDPADAATFDFLIKELEELKGDLKTATIENLAAGLSPEELTELNEYQHDVRELQRMILDHINAMRARARGENAIAEAEKFTSEEKLASYLDDPKTIETGANLTESNYGILPFDDGHFYGMFVASLRDWRDIAKAALQSAQLDMMNIKADEVKFHAGDFWKTIKDAASVHPVGDAIVSVIDTIESGWKNYEIYKNSAEPSIAPVAWIRNKLEESFDTAAKEKAARPAFKLFISKWKEANGFPASVTDVYKDEFETACLNFGTNLDQTLTIKRSFLAMVVDACQDTRDRDTDKDANLPDFPDAGYVDIIAVLPEGKFEWKVVSVKLNDVDKPIKEAVKQSWKNEPIFNLPFPIRYRCSNTTSRGRVVNIVHDFEAVRTSRLPGNLTLNVVKFSPGAEAFGWSEKSMKHFEKVIETTLVNDIK
jgi:hypothetical protein